MSREPCDWPVGELCPDLEGESPASPGDLHPAVDMAIAILWGATGYQYGTCAVTVVICQDYCTSRTWCCERPEIRLPGPVESVDEVYVYGELLDPTAYQVEDYRYLVRIDGGTWPREVTVTYDHGFSPPAGADVATAELACELARAMSGDKECRLPQRIQSKTRQGVTVRFPDFEAGRTGLPLVDMWIASAKNPEQPPRIHTPDGPIIREVTG